MNSGSGAAAPSDIKAKLDSFARMLEADGISIEEASFPSFSGNTVSNLETAPLGTADFLPALFFPREGIGAGTAASGMEEASTAVKMLSQNAAGDEYSAGIFARAALDGEEPLVREAFSEIATLAGDIEKSPLTILGELGKRVKEQLGGGANDAGLRFANDCLAGREGPLARAIAEIEARGECAPAEMLKRMNGDIDAVMLHATPGDVFFGLEGARRAMTALGPVGQGYAELDSSAGEVSDYPTSIAEDLKGTAKNVLGEVWMSFKRSVVGIYRWFRGWIG